MIPPQVILIPITQVLRALHLMTTLPGLILFNVGYYVPFGVFVFAGFIRGVPVELEEAAVVDGRPGCRCSGGSCSRCCGRPPPA